MRLSPWPMRAHLGCQVRMFVGCVKAKQKQQGVSCLCSRQLSLAVRPQLATFKKVPKCNAQPNIYLAPFLPLSLCVWLCAAGLDEVKALLQELIVWPMLNPELFTVSESSASGSYIHRGGVVGK